ncbi:hypothetical protein JCM6882_002785, partial [Rhodosporidiobolus microsporus]
RSPHSPADEEVKAVRVLQSALQNHPQSYSLLHVQCDFLRGKGKHDWALKLAKQAVNCAPSEFVTWAKLTEVNMELGRYTDALLTLNSCPMFTYNERDLHRMPTPARSHLPIKDFIAASGILDDESSLHSSDADVALLRLPAPSLRGTFAKAYVLLAKLVSYIGWDELLKARSQVFVMEEEYRMHRATDPVPESPMAPPKANGVGIGGGSGMDGGDDESVTEGFGPLAIATDDESDAGSVKGARVPARASSSTPTAANPAAAAAATAPSASPVPTIAVNGETEDGRRVSQDEELNGGAGSPSSPGSPAIPTIKVSTESDGEREREELRRFEESEAGRKAREEVAAPPGAKQVPEDGAEEGKEEGVTAAAVANGQDEPANGGAFQNKRLCERWLDNLFMVLYEDLRVYTIWRAEIAHFKAQHLPYRKTGTEWEILGELAQRLHHKEESKDAYQRALDQKFSAKAWLKLLEYYSDEGDVQRALNAAIRLSAYQHRWYYEAAYPTAVAHQLFKLIRRDGLAKISYSLVSMNVPQAILKGCMQPYFAYAQTFRATASFSTVPPELKFRIAEALYELEPLSTQRTSGGSQTCAEAEALSLVNKELHALCEPLRWRHVDLVSLSSSVFHRFLGTRFRQHIHRIRSLRVERTGHKVWPEIYDTAEELEIEMTGRSSRRSTETPHNTTVNFRGVHETDSDKQEYDAEGVFISFLLWATPNLRNLVLKGTHGFPRLVEGFSMRTSSTLRLDSLSLLNILPGFAWKDDAAPLSLTRLSLSSERPFKPQTLLFSLRPTLVYLYLSLVDAAFPDSLDAVHPFPHLRHLSLAMQTSVGPALSFFSRAPLVHLEVVCAKLEGAATDLRAGIVNFFFALDSVKLSVQPVTGPSALGPHWKSDVLALEAACEARGIRTRVVVPDK